jgi:hypothetical protein
MQTCQRNGWTLATWTALADSEKDEWLAWAWRRMEGIKLFQRSLIDHASGNLLTPEAATMLFEAMNL